MGRWSIMAILFPVLESEKDTTEVRKALLSIDDQIRGLGGPGGSGASSFREVLMLVSYVSANAVSVAPGRLYAQDETSQIRLEQPFTVAIPATNNTWFYLYALKNTITNSVVVVADTNGTTPTLPSGFTLSRRVGAVRTDGAGAIRPFDQYERDFVYRTPVLDVDTTTQGTSSTQRTLSVPPAYPVAVDFNLSVANASTDTNRVYVRSTEAADLAPSATASPLATLRGGSVTGYADGSKLSGFKIKDGTLWTRANGTNTTVRLATLGWTDLTL
jgi:hypothetical protein